MRFRADRKGSCYAPSPDRSLCAVTTSSSSGPGPAGQRAAIQGAKCGRKVAVIEQREIVGGACINTGTIPSKTMREAVLHLSGFQFQGIYGVNYHVKDKITMADLGFRVNQVIKTEVDVTQAQLARNGVEVIIGRASFHRRDACPRRQHRAAPRISKRPTIIIATGTKPAVSPTVPLNGRTIMNSDQILLMAEIPRTLIVVGGGVIGVEYACMFAILGVRVILIEKRPRLLEFADQEIIETLSYHLRDHRVTMRLNEEVKSVEEIAGRRRGRQSREQQAHFRRRAALRGRAAGECGRAEPGGRRARSGLIADASRSTPNIARRSRTSTRSAT